MASKNNSEKPQGWCMKLRSMQEFETCEVVKSKRGYMLKGATKDGFKMAKVCSEEQGLQLISEGLATKGF
jgi:hypothetical protein